MPHSLCSQPIFFVAMLAASVAACDDGVAAGPNDGDTTGGTTGVAEVSGTTPELSTTTGTSSGVSGAETGTASGADESSTTGEDEPGSTSIDGSTSTGRPGDECGDGVVQDGEECDGKALAGATCPIFGDISCTDGCTLDDSACSDALILCSSPGAVISDIATPFQMPLSDVVGVNEDLFVTDVNVSVDLEHTYTQDLSAVLVSPDDAAGAVLFDRPCGSADNIDARFDDDGGEPVCGALPALSGDIRPLTELENLIGINATGDWTFTVWDAAAQDAGVLNEWCIELILSEDDPVSCGDAVTHYGEACDGLELNGADCVSQGFLGGTLGCMADCSGFDTSMCVESGCNGSVIDGAEVCDGANLGDQTCETQGNFSGGTLGCNEDCTAFDTSMCTPEVCGNGEIGGTEDCEADNLAGQDCTSLSTTEGVLGCTDECTFDTSACTPIEGCTEFDITADLDGSEGSYNRADYYEGTCTLSAAATSVFYDVYTFSAVEGEEPLFSTCGQADFDTYLFVYQAADGSPEPFDPDTPCNNLFELNDDFAGCAGFTSELAVPNLVAGEYQLVVTSYSSAETGSYTLSRSCE